MKHVPLANGKGFAIVDDADYPVVSQYSWYLHNSRHRNVSYAFSSIYPNGKANKVALAMHRLILNPGPGQFVDHINGNGLDNRRENLRVCNRSQNNMNRSATRTNKTGYKGVVKNGNAYQAGIGKDKKRVSLGRFKTPEEAARAYDRAAIELHGEFACLNFPTESTAI